MAAHGYRAQQPERNQAGAEAPSDFTDEYDLPAEVDATVRVVRRVAVGYFALFLVAVLAVPGLTVALDWWWQGRVIGGMSPNFVMAAVGLYVVFFVLAIAAALLVNAVEQRMLGGMWHRTDDGRNGES